MENNQEHKIDKIFRETFENQEITPPSDAWTCIHTYTIGQKEKKPKTWLKYVSLATLFLLISGFGMWYFVDNQVIADVNTPVSLSQEVVSGDTRSNRKTQITALQNAGRTLNPASVKTSNQLARLSIDSFDSEINHRIQDLNSHEALIKTSTIENKPLIIVDSLSNHSNELAEPLSYSTDNKLEFIEPKPLIFDNLSGEIQKKNENKIMALEENMVDKKAVFKADSVDYGSKFSLRHPIISYGLEMSNTNWDVTRNIGNNNWVKPDNSYLGEPIRLGYALKLGVSWKLNKKFRSGVNLSYGNISLGYSPSITIPYSSNIKYSSDFATRKSNNLSYQVRTSFGDVEIPIDALIKSNYPPLSSLRDSSRIDLWFSPQSMESMTLTFSNQYDLIFKQRMKRKRYTHQLYGLIDFNILRQIHYLFNATDVSFLSPSSASPLYRSFLITKNNNHLQNASEFVFGLRAGLGFRYQFARKWDFYIESSGQHSLNNWVKSDDIKTFQKALSVQAGINLNL